MSKRFPNYGPRKKGTARSSARLRQAETARLCGGRGRNEIGAQLRQAFATFETRSGGPPRARLADFEKFPRQGRRALAAAFRLFKRNNGCDTNSRHLDGEWPRQRLGGSRNGSEKNRVPKALGAGRKGPDRAEIGVLRSSCKLARPDFFFFSPAIRAAGGFAGPLGMKVGLYLDVAVGGQSGRLCEPGLRASRHARFFSANFFLGVGAGRSAQTRGARTGACRFTAGGPRNMTYLLASVFRANIAGGRRCWLCRAIPEQSMIRLWS